MVQTQLVGSLIAALGVSMSLLAIGHALLYKRRPQSAFGWIAVCFTLPLLGPVLYYVFGINRVELRARKLFTGQPETLCPITLAATAPTGLEALGQLGLAVTAWPLVAGNSIEVLHDGAAAFPAMLDTIRNARRRLYFSTYILDSGPVGREFAAELGAATRRGVDVRVLIDGVGALYSWPRARRMLEREGVRCATFLPPRLVPPSFSVNLRNHRKILVADGAIALTGGANIRERYLPTPGEDSPRIRDMHFRLQGPIAAQIEAVFRHDWQFVTGEADLVQVVDFERAGSAVCRAVAEGPDMDRLTELLVGAIGNARRRIAIMTPYFLPPREMMAPLQAAALQGVDVTVILPAENNLPYVHRASRHMLWELVRRRVNVYYQPPPFVHSKLFYIDDDYAQIGSANIDSRSLRLNFELNVEVYDRRFVGVLHDHFTHVREQSRKVTLEELDGRSLATKLIDGGAWLFAPYL